MFTGEFNSLCTHLTVLANGNILHMLLHGAVASTWEKGRELASIYPHLVGNHDLGFLFVLFFLTT